MQLVYTRLNVYKGIFSRIYQYAGECSRLHVEMRGSEGRYERRTVGNDTIAVE